MRKILKVITASALVLVLVGSALFSSTETIAAASKLKVTPKSKTIYVGKTIKLRSNKNVKWSIAKGKGKIKLTAKKKKTVKVKALKAGTAYVKAKQGKTVKKIKIVVKKRKTGNAPTSVTLKTNRPVIILKQFCLVYISSVTPANASKEVTWTTSNKDIATVDQYGMVTGVSPGSVTISAVSKVDNKVKGKITIRVADVKYGTVKMSIGRTSDGAPEGIADPDKYPAGAVAKLWVPIPSTDYAQKISNVQYEVPDEAASHVTVEETTDSAGNKALYFEWDSEIAPEYRTAKISFFIQRNEIIPPGDLAELEQGEINKEEFAEYLKETAYSGSLTSGIVKETADKIVKDAGAVTVYEKAYAIYDWVAEHLTRDFSTPGLGKGDVEYILTHLDGGIGKCTDVNSVFDALCRAEGIPARGIFGMKFDTCGQKCKPQFYLPGYGWADADPSELLKQIMGNEDLYRGQDAPLADKWTELKAKYWGTADANWFMFSEGRDITLSPEQAAAEADSDHFLNEDGKLNYFVFPYAEYDGKYVMSHSKKLFPYTYEFVEWEDCGC